MTQIKIPLHTGKNICFLLRRIKYTLMAEKPDIARIKKDIDSIETLLQMEAK